MASSAQWGGLATSDGQTIFATSLVFQMIAALAICLRIWAKQIRNRPFENHDYLIFASFLFDLGYTFIICIAVIRGGVGFHLEDLNRADITLTLKIVAANPFIWVAATTFAKASILCFYMSVFRKKYIRIACFITGSIVLSYCVAFSLANLLYCRPFAYIWDKTIDGKCTNSVANEMLSAAINMAMDSALVILPLPEVWALQLPVRKKVQMSFIFSFGLAICVVNIMRIYYEAAENEEDITFALVKPGLSAALEVNLGIISACIPPCRPLLRHSFLNSGPKIAKCDLHVRPIGTAAKISNYNESKASQTLHWLDNDNIFFHGVTHTPPLHGAAGSRIGAHMSINSINGDSIMVETNGGIDDIGKCRIEDV